MFGTNNTQKDIYYFNTWKYNAFIAFYSFFVTILSSFILYYAIITMAHQKQNQINRIIRDTTASTNSLPNISVNDENEDVYIVPSISRKLRVFSEFRL